MDLNFTLQENNFRETVREFARREVTPDVLVRTGGLIEKYDEIFYRKLAGHGWIGMQWPARYGGQGKSHLEFVIFLEEMAYALAPLGRYIGTVIFVGESIRAYGSEWQRRHFLPRISRGEITCSLCLTEPEAGSDAAALQTRAEEKNGDYRVSGQKIFISGAELSAYGMVVARTAPRTNKKTGGISIFLVDLKSPGITLRPLWTIGGWRVNQIFFDGVRVPAKMLMGEKNEGWKHLTRQTLNFERSSVARVGLAARLCDDLLAYVREIGKQAPGVPTPLLHRLAEFKAQILSWRLMAYRIAWMQSRGRTPAAAASIVKLCSSEGLMQLAELGMDIMGHQGRLSSGTRNLAGRLEWMYRAAQFHVTGGGTSEIQRNLIARLALDLPHTLRFKTSPSPAEGTARP